MLDLSSLVAGHGQEVLIGLDEAGLLEQDILSEACARVLLRPEKKLGSLQELMSRTAQRVIAAPESPGDRPRLISLVEARALGISW